MIILDIVLAVGLLPKEYPHKHTSQVECEQCVVILLQVHTGQPDTPAEQRATDCLDSPKYAVQDKSEVCVFVGLELDLAPKVRPVANDLDSVGVRGFHIKLEALGVGT